MTYRGIHNILFDNIDLAVAPSIGLVSRSLRRVWQGLRGGRFYLCAGRFLFLYRGLIWSDVFSIPCVAVVPGFQRLGMHLSDFAG